MIVKGEPAPRNEVGRRRKKLKKIITANKKKRVKFGILIQHEEK